MAGSTMASPFYLASQEDSLTLQNSLDWTRERLSPLALHFEGFLRL